MANDRAVILASGGLNSAVAAAIARESHDLAMLHVRIGHRADEREFGLFQKQADHFGAAQRLVAAMPHFLQMGGNARMDRKRQIEDALAIKEFESDCYVPGIIGALTSAALTWARCIGATRVFLGISENLGPPGPPTFQVYPDYGREFVQVCQDAYELASPTARVTLETPLLDMSRAEIVSVGATLGVPFELTWSCISSGSEPCGACLGCATRNRGFVEASIPDPTLLQPAGR
jgi:7-cyano-7-deazaguanine synthase